MAAMPNRNGLSNSLNAPPPLLSTMPVRILTTLFPNDIIGSVLFSHCLQVSPRNELSAGSSSVNGFGLGIAGSSPYQPIAEALITAFILLGVSCNDLASSSLLLTRLSNISCLRFFVQRLSAIPAPEIGRAHV